MLSMRSRRVRFFLVRLFVEEEFRERKTTPKHDPRQPSEQGRIDYEMTHLPFISWCRQCMHQGEAAREEDCRKESEEETSCRNPFGQHNNIW